MNEIILEQIAIWTPKVTNRYTRHVSPAGVNYREKDSNILKKSDKKLYRFAKNYYLGGEPVVDIVPIEKADEIKIENIDLTEVNTDENPDTEESSAVEIVEEQEKEEIDTEPDTEPENDEQEPEVAESEPEAPKFCLFVRTFEDSADIERKLDEVAKRITEQEILAALGRVKAYGPMSFEYTKYNLEEIN